jgi:uncharacterized protein (TIGR03086 family)
MRIDFPDLRKLDETTVRASVGVVQRLSDADLDRPTPCSQWHLGDLLAHMTVQHLGFAAAAAGHGADPGLWRPRPSPEDPAGAYARAAGKVLAAFAPDDVLDREFALPEVGTAHTVPGRMAIGFHFVDYVVHGWDVARSVGVAWQLPDEVLRAALLIAEAVPDDGTRLAEGAAFGPRHPEPDDDDLLGRILALLGRAPDWTPA